MAAPSLTSLAAWQPGR